MDKRWVGAALHRIRTLAGVGLDDAADAARVSRASVSQWENGYRIPTLEQLGALSERYDIPLDTLLAEIGYLPGPPAVSFREWYMARLARQSLAAPSPVRPPADRGSPDDPADGPRIPVPNAGWGRVLVGGPALSFQS